MMELPFDLVPLPNSKIPDIRITGSVTRKGNVYTVKFYVSGKINDILFPGLHPEPKRKHGLWQSTCFEFFLAFPEQQPYWEFNISPSGNWNVYRMDSYRQIGFREEELIQSLQLDIRKHLDCFQLHAVADLSPVLASEKQILVGVASIIKTHDGNETYWAVKHIRPQADFHLRESFTLVLEG
jgi:hypothetical protein